MPVTIQQINDNRQFDPQHGYTPRDAACTNSTDFGKNRESLEEWLEENPRPPNAAHDSATHSPGSTEVYFPWLGQIVGDYWEVREKYVEPILTYILGGLVRSGHVELVEIEGAGGRFRRMWIASNR